MKPPQNISKLTEKQKKTHVKIVSTLKQNVVGDDLQVTSVEGDGREGAHDIDPRLPIMHCKSQNVMTQAF